MARSAAIERPRSYRLPQLEIEIVRAVALAVIAALAILVVLPALIDLAAGGST